MGEILLLEMTVHINESSMVNILYFAEFANIVGVHINMDTSKERVNNFCIKDKDIIHIKSYTEGLLKKKCLTKYDH